MLLIYLYQTLCNTGKDRHSYMDVAALLHVVDAHCQHINTARGKTHLDSTLVLLFTNTPTHSVERQYRHGVDMLEDRC